MKEVELFAFGSGPAGLGIACQMQEKGSEWLMLDVCSEVGGLASSHTDDRGVTWNLGGWVL